MHYELHNGINTEPRRLAQLLRAHPELETVRELSALVIEELTAFMEATSECVSKEQFAAIVERNRLRQQDRRKPDAVADN